MIKIISSTYRKNGKPVCNINPMCVCDVCVCEKRERERERERERGEEEEEEEEKENAVRMGEKKTFCGRVCTRGRWKTFADRRLTRSSST